MKESTARMGPKKMNDYHFGKRKMIKKRYKTPLVQETN